MKNIILTLLMLTGCASEWKCPNAPKVVAKFSVGDHVAFTRSLAVWHSRSSPQSFYIKKGDTGVVADIHYFDTMVSYEIILDKAGYGELMLAPAYEGLFNGREQYDIEAVVYPDPALAPSNGKQKE